MGYKNDPEKRREMERKRRARILADPERAEQFRAAEREKVLRHYYRNHDKQIKRMREWRENNAELMARIKQNTRLKGLYGITAAEYDELFDAQGGVCAICSGTCFRKNLSVDHDHESGDVRGLLCNNCNAVLGLAQEDTKILRRAIRYLERHKEKAVMTTESARGVDRLNSTTKPEGGGR